MKRLVAAVICGFAITFCYGVPASMLSRVLLRYPDSEALRWLLYFPVGWPRLILQHLVPSNAFPFREGDSTALLVFMFIANIALYGLFAYVCLLVLSKRSKPQARLPPPPTVQQ